MGNSSAKAIAWFDSNVNQLKHYYDDALNGSFARIICDRLPTEPADILDLGAGTGIVSAYCADRGHRVIAVEPSAAMRTLATPLNYIMLDDSWPDMAATRAMNVSFDIVIELAMRMFVDAADRATGFANAISMLKPGGHYYVLVKHAAFTDDRGAYPIAEDEVLALATDNNLEIIYNELQPDIRGRGSLYWRGYIFKKN